MKLHNIFGQPKRIDLNKLAKTITIREGKKKSVDIAQVKEILSITLDELSKHSNRAIIATIKK
jgi:hypothetical protein